MSKDMIDDIKGLIGYIVWPFVCILAIWVSRPIVLAMLDYYGK